MSSIGPLAAPLIERTRPMRVRLFPRRYKESYVNVFLDGLAAPTTYLEIGVRKGYSLRAVNAARKIGIDPVRTEEMRDLRPNEEFFALTSDEFFASIAADVLKPRSIHVAMIDGLHEFTQVVRDFLNLELYMREDGAVFLDDFNPVSAERAAETPTGDDWNGDVWKLAVLLRRWRGDLSVSTVDADEGVGVVTGFGGTAEQPPGIPETAVDECKRLDYSVLAASRKELLGLIRPGEFGNLVAAHRRGGSARVREGSARRHA